MTLPENSHHHNGFDPILNAYAEQSKPMLVSVAELLDGEIKVGYLINRLIELDTTGQLFGPSGGGKTFVALDIAAAVATAEPTLNGCCTERRGIILYLAGEGFGGLRRRVKAWLSHKGASPSDLKLLYISRTTIDLDGAGLTDAVAEGRRLADFHGLPVALIVIDTLARHIAGDENSTRDMSAFIRAVDSLRASFPGSVALIVHHTGHGEEAKARGRGSSALRAAMDFELQCDKGLLTFTKMKDGELPEPIPFKLRPVVIGQDEQTEPLTSCVVEYGERSERHQSADLTVMERLAVKCLIGASVQAKEQRNGLWCALVGDWRSTFYDHRRAEDPEVKTNTVKNAFLTATRGLVEKKIVIEDGDHRALSSQTYQEEITTSMVMPQPSPVIQASFPVISDGAQLPSGVISPYKGDDDLTPAHDATLTPAWGVAQ